MKGSLFVYVQKEHEWAATIGEFVEDAKLLHQGGLETSAEDLQAIAKKDIQLWTDLLWAVRGEIKFIKTSTI